MAQHNKAEVDEQKYSIESIKAFQKNHQAFFTRTIEALEKLNKEMEEDLVEAHKNRLVDLSTNFVNFIQKAVEGLTKLITDSESSHINTSNANTQKLSTLMDKLLEQFQNLSLDSDHFFVCESMVVPSLQ